MKGLADDVETARLNTRHLKFVSIRIDSQIQTAEGKLGHVVRWGQGCDLQVGQGHITKEINHLILSPLSLPAKRDASPCR